MRDRKVTRETQWVFFLVILLLGNGFPVQAQLIPNAQPQTTEEKPQQWPEDSLERRTPRGTVAGFIRSVSEKNYVQASQYLDIEGSGIANSRGPELARILEGLLNQRGNILPYSLISDDYQGKMDDNLPSDVDEVGTLHLEHELIDLYVEQVNASEEPPLWLFSSETITSLANLGELENTVLLVDRLIPDFLKDVQWEGVSIGQWMITVILAAVAYLLSWLLLSLIILLVPKIWKKAGTDPTAGIIKAFALPARLYLAVWLFLFLTQQTGISIIVRQRFSGLTLIIGIIALLILLWRLTDFIGDFSKHRMSLRGKISWVSIILFLKRAAKVAIVVFGVIAILGAVGVDITTGLAALGIGGIALALGAQKTIENFVGSVTLVTDQPVRVGDFCKVGDTVGTVEKIGMRSTRIRTLDRTIVTIPNGQFSSDKIENYAHRDRFWFHPVLDLRYETTPDQIRFLLVELRSILYAHPMVDPDPARIRFIGLGAASLQLEVFAYINAATFDEFLEVREDLLLRMMDKVADSGTDFAFPSQTLYFARDKGVSPKKGQEVGEKVKNWKEKDELQIPNFNPDKINEIRNTISYPPEGSVKRKKPDKP